MKMDLWYIPEFGWRQSLVLGGDRGEIDELRHSILGFHKSNDEILPIHSLPFVLAHAGVKLYAVRAGNIRTDGCNWVCSDSDIETIGKMLWALIIAERPGHQYFDLYPEEFELIVSFAEYGPRLWTDSAVPELSPVS